MKQAAKHRSHGLISSLIIPPVRRASFGGDLLRLLVVLGLDIAFLSTIIPHQMLRFTLVWLTFIFVVRSPMRSLALMLIAALTLEQHSSLPAGTYACSYGIAMTIITVLRKQVAWRNYFPWLVTMATVQLWVVLFEFFVFYIKDASFFANNISYIASQGVRLIFGIAVGTIYYLNNSNALGEDQSFGVSS